jgi:hypothetical protein
LKYGFSKVQALTLHLLSKLPSELLTFIQTSCQMKLIIIAAVLPLLLSCHHEKLVTVSPSSAAIGHYGRTVFDRNNDIVLIGSASYVEFTFTGDSCRVFLKNIAPGADDYNYVSIELDNEYKGRIKVAERVRTAYTIKATTNSSSHLLRIYKATEPHNGVVVFAGALGKGITATEHPSRKKIEFIGNSITAAMAADLTEIPCGQGKWYDQHNAYYSYASRTARAVGADFLISAVSGIGIYRNWNSLAPTMPQVYESAYLEIDSTQRWDFSHYTPDVVTINLGTNDLSDGDGKSARLPFDSAIYTNTYIKFIGTIYQHYPNTQIVLLTSPMVNGPRGDLLFTLLQRVQVRCREVYPGKKNIQVFRFQPMEPKGCSYHPDLNDHAIMAKQLEPFLRRILNNL